MSETAGPLLSLLIIDDDLGSLELLSTALAQPGLEILTANDPEEGLDVACSRHPHIVLTDLVMPNLSGMEVLERIVEVDPGIEVILMTAHYSTETAVEAIQKGASDYLNKPIPLATLRQRIEKLIQESRRQQRSIRLEEELRSTSDFEGIIGRSPLMLQMFSRIQRVAPHYRAALVIGATGTGKDLAAQALHRLSPVASTGRYVVLNCSAIVETLFESELFGHVKGSFTGAMHDKPGLFEHAHGGTIFLDEIGDMPLGTQAKLLRVLQNQEIQRIGALNTRKVDVRVVAATNHDLQSAVAEKRFRQDLYYRLAMVEIPVPPLMSRTGDLPLLQRHFTHRFATQFGKNIRGITRRAQIRLAQHTWPGNVRELENVIGHGAMMTLGDMIDVEDLPPYLHTRAAQPAPVVPFPPVDIGALEDHERELVVRAMAAANGNQSKAARILRIGRDALRYKLRKYNLDAPDPQSSAAAG